MREGWDKKIRKGEKVQNLIDLEENQGTGAKRESYADALGGKTINRRNEFPNLRSQDSPNARQGRFLRAIGELENDETGQRNPKEDRNGRNMSKWREQVIGEIVNKLRDELKVDVLRIIREEVRENLKIIIGNAIREEVEAMFQEGRSSVVR